MRSRSRWCAASATIAALSLFLAIPAAGAKTKPAPKMTFMSGIYDLRTSPALEGGDNTGKRVSFLMEFTLTKTPARDCGGSKTARGTVFCLTGSDIGAYGTYSTTGVSANCTDDLGEPTVAGGWNPVLRVPANGRITVDQVIRTDQGEPSQLIKARLDITKKGVMTGTYTQTLYVSTGAAPFLGCTTGTLTLKGKRVSASG